MNKNSFLIGRFLKAIFWAMAAFWATVFFREYIQYLAAHNNILAQSVAGLPYIQAALILAALVFLWVWIRNGLFRLVIVIALVTGTVTFLYTRQDQLFDFLISRLDQINLLTNQFTQKDEPIYTQSALLSDDPVPIYYVDDGIEETGVNPGLVDELVEFVSILPEELTQRAAAVYLVEDGAFDGNQILDNGMEVFGYSSNQSMSSSIRLITNPSFNQYTQLKSGEYVFLDNPAFYEETLVHELAHLLDMNAATNQTSYSDLETFQALYKAHPDLISEYGASDPGEYFAETAIYFYLYPEHLQSVYPELFDFMNYYFPHY